MSEDKSRCSDCGCHKERPACPYMVGGHALCKAVSLGANPVEIGEALEQARAAQERTSQILASIEKVHERLWGEDTVQGEDGAE